MIKLEESSLIGSGRHRKCYVHPDDDSKCVKIVAVGDMKETRRETDYYLELEKRNVPFTMISRYYGTVATNLGKGSVFKLIRDCDGRVSQSLENRLKLCARKPGDSGAEIEDLLLCLSSLKKHMLENRIVTMTLKSKNIVYKKIGRKKGCLVIVDSLGNSDFIPFTKWSCFLATRKIRRRWRLFEQTLASEYGSLKGFEKLGSLLS